MLGLPLVIEKGNLEIHLKQYSVIKNPKILDMHYQLLVGTYQ